MDKITESLLAGLKDEADNPDAADERFIEQAAALGEDDMLMPPEQLGQSKVKNPKLPPTKLR